VCVRNDATSAADLTITLKSEARVARLRDLLSSLSELPVVAVAILCK